MKSSKITALILCFCLMLSMTACGSNNSTENKTNSNKAASGSAVTENKKTSHDVSDVDGPALKDLYAKYFMMGAAINGSDKSTAAIHHEGMAFTGRKGMCEKGQKECKCHRCFTEF